MKLKYIAMLLCFKLSFLTTQASAASEFSSPWKDKTKAIVIDPYAENDIDWDKLASDKRVVGIIHKATDGLNSDQKYLARKKEALKRGYLWGSYHLGRPGDPVKQAQHYLRVTEPGPNELIALDLESINSKFMSLAAARKFIEYIVKDKRRYPLLYVNHATAREISNTLGDNKLFGMTPLWYARFRKDIPDFPKGSWTTYTLWQFSSEINCYKQNTCLYNVPGTRFDMDVNIFFGSTDELKAKWPLTRSVSD